MSFSLIHQVCKNSDPRSSTLGVGSRRAEKKDSFIAVLENNVREVLLFSTSLIFLLFNLLDGNSDRKADV